MIDGKNVAWITYKGVDSFFSENISKAGVDVINPLISVSKIGKAFRRIAYTQRKRMDRWYVNKNYNFDQYDLIIVEKSPLLFGFILKIVESHVKSKIIVWDCNSCFGDFDDYGLRKYGVIFSSFDPKDCEQFGLLYNPDFFFENYFTGKRFNEKSTDFCFVGKDKGRRGKIESIQKTLMECGYSSYIYIPKGKKDDSIPYSKYLEIVNESKVIIDVTKDGQFGLSLRPLEALYSGGKILTDNPLIKKMDYFNANDVFLLGEQALTSENLKVFYELPYIHPSDEMIHNHAFSSWIKAFY